MNVLEIPLKTKTHRGACILPVDNLEELDDMICSHLDQACCDSYDEGFEFEFDTLHFNPALPTILIFKKGMQKENRLRVFLHEVVHAYDILKMTNEEIEKVND
jgi:hypothetical protein